MRRRRLCRRLVSAAHRGFFGCADYSVRESRDSAGGEANGWRDCADSASGRAGIYAAGGSVRSQGSGDCSCIIVNSAAPRSNGNAADGNATDGKDNGPTASSEGGALIAAASFGDTDSGHACAGNNVPCRQAIYAGRRTTDENAASSGGNPIEAGARTGERSPWRPAASHRERTWL